MFPSMNDLPYHAQSLDRYNTFPLEFQVKSLPTCFFEIGDNWLLKE